MVFGNKERRVRYTVRKLPMQDADQALISIRTAAKRQLRRNAMLPRNLDSSDGLKPVQDASMAVNSPDSRRISDARKQHARKYTRQLRADAAWCLLTVSSHFTDGEWNRYEHPNYKFQQGQQSIIRS